MTTLEWLCPDGIRRIVADRKELDFENRGRKESPSRSLFITA